MKKEKIKLIIFDFDGTIADSFQLCFDSINEALVGNGQTKMTERERDLARKLSSKDVFNYFKIPAYRIPFAVKRIMTGMRKNFHKVQIFAGIKIVLRELKKDNVRMMILTSNIEGSVSEFLERERIADFFEDVYFKSGLFSKHKIINRIVKKNKLKTKEVLMIGDEVRDIDAARESKIKIAAVVWGFNGKNILEKNKPDFILNKPIEILDIINK